MSNSPDTVNDKTDQLPTAFRDLGKMLSSGRSFSGRERNCCFLNTCSQPSAKGRFANVSATSGLDFPDDGRSVVSLDWDQDGDLDLWITNRNAPRIRFMRNESALDMHFISFRLVGNGTTTNRDAVGARIELRALDSEGSDNFPPLIQTLQAGEGFQSQSSKFVHFGLGETTGKVNVIVRWPDYPGTTQHFGTLAVDRKYELRQDEERAIELSDPGTAQKTAPGAQTRRAPVERLRFPCIVRLPMVGLPYTSWESDEPTTLKYADGRTTILILWSANCAPCLRELSQIAEHDSVLRANKIDVVALNVDEFIDDEFDSSIAIRYLKSIEFPFRSGAASQSLVAYLERIYGYQAPMTSDFPLPTSFLIDSAQRLSYVYKGPVSTDQIIRDAGDMITTPSARFEIAASLPGRSIDSPIVRQKMKEQEFKIRYRLADDLRRSNRLSAAIGEFQTAIELDPRSSSAHNNLGLCLRAAGRIEEAKASYQSALELDNASSEAHNNLGVVLMKQRDFDTAILHFRKALHFRPMYVDALMNLGIACQQKKEFKKAMACFKHVLTLRPNHVPALLQLGVVSENESRLQDAVRLYETILSIESKNADAHHNLGVVLARLGNVTQGMRHLKEAIQFAPHRADAHNNLGLLYESQNQLAEAKRCFTKAIEMDPSYIPARQNLRNINALGR